jgi:hemoglobin/transferrin/lactoferrin receptor protein
VAAGRAPQRRLNDPVNLDDNRIPAGGTPGYVTYNLRGRLVQDIFTLRLALDNITDELVLEHGSGFYRAGFSVMASLEVRVDP